MTYSIVRECSVRNNIILDCNGNHTEINNCHAVCEIPAIKLDWRREPAPCSVVWEWNKAEVTKTPKIGGEILQDN